MKKATKKTALMASTAAFLALCAGGALGNVPATAEVSSDLVMKSGASLYLDEVSGLKFAYSISNYDENANKNYGMVIVPYDYLETAGISLTDGDEEDYVTLLKAATLPNAPIIVENIAPKQSNGEWLVEHSVTNLKEQNYVREWFGVGFEKSGDSYVYATQNDNVRSVFEVANLAQNKIYTDAFDETDAEELAEKNKLLANDELLDGYITKGFDFVYGDAALNYGGTYVANDESGAISLTLTKAADKENIDLTSQLHWEIEVENDGVATVAKDAWGVTPVAFGTTTFKATLGGAKTLEVAVPVYADEAQYTLAQNYSEGTVDVDGTQAARVTFNEDGSMTLQSETVGDGYIQALRNRSLAYVAFEGPHDVGTYVDIEFKGNNMPIVRMFADEINGRIATIAATTDNPDPVGDAGALFVNGTIDTSTSDKSINQDSGFYINETLYTSYMNNSSSALGVYNPGYYMTGLKMSSLIATPNQEYKYTVGSFKDESDNVVVNMLLYKKVDGAWELMHSVVRPLTVTGTTYDAGSIVLMAALKGTGEWNTFKCSMPYQFNQADGVVGHNALWTKDGNDYNVTMYSKNYATIKDDPDATKASKWDKNDNYSYLAFAGSQYGVGTYMDFEFTGTQIPVVRMFANTVNGLVTTYTDTTVKGLFFNNGYRDAENLKYWKAHYTDGGLNSDSSWTPWGSRMLSYGLDSSTRYKYTIGTYLDGSDATVCLEWRLYSWNTENSTWTEITYSDVESHAVENTKDTGIKLSDWFDSGSIVLLPPIGAGDGTVNSFTCRIYTESD